MEQLVQRIGVKLVTEMKKLNIEHLGKTSLELDKK